MIHAFHPEAGLEYREAAIFYDNRGRGLGAAFTLEVEATIERIVEAPERWPSYRTGRQKMPDSHLSLRYSLHN